MPRTRRWAHRHFPPRGQPLPALVSRGGQTWRVVGLYSRAPIRCISDGNGVEGRLPHREAGSSPSRHMLPPGHLRPEGKPPVGLGSGGSRLPGSPLPYLACFSPVRGGSGDARGWGPVLIPAAAVAEAAAVVADNGGARTDTLTSTRSSAQPPPPTPPCLPRPRLPACPGPGPTSREIKGGDSEN